MDIDLTDFEEQKTELLDLLNQTHRIAFLTGAGVSTNSGIPDFQTLDATWPFPVPRTEATSLAFFRRDPKTFWAAYRYLFDLKTEAHPNSFHKAVAGLEAKGKDVVVLTQNIDGLHEAGGSSNVAALHGNMLWAKCSRNSCPERRLIAHLRDQPLPRCTRCRKYLRPDVCLFGEAPRQFLYAQQVCLDADMLIVAGTALEVGPVNDLPRYRETWLPGADTVWMNQHGTPYGYRFSHLLVADLSVAAEVLNSFASAAPFDESPLSPFE